MVKLDHKNYHVPGIIVAFSKGSDLPEAFSSGLADVDMGTSWPLSGRFQIGQITETLCVALVLNCIKEYGFSLDSSLLQISRDFTNDNGQFRLIIEEYNQLKPVTIRDLLQHSSGLPSYDQTTAYLYRMSKNPKKTWQTEAYLDLITGVDVEFCDGYWKEKRGVHALSATNYFLAGIALESITGQSLVDLMTQLFEQHGLVNTFYCPNGVVKKDLSNLVHGYMPTSFPYADIFRSLPIISYNGSRELRAYDVTAAYNLNGLAGMAGLSSITDLIAWMQILWRERLFGDPMSTFFGRPASIHREGKKNRGEFGLGFRRAKLYPYGELIWSKGRVYGYETLMGYSLDKDLTFALAVNSNRSPLRMLTGSELVDDFFEQVLS